MNITVHTQDKLIPLILPEGSLVRDALESAALPVRKILGVRTRSGVMELGDPLEADLVLSPLTLLDAEGRRIYERSLRFVMLMALDKLFPGKQVRIEHSVPGGLFVRLPECALSSLDVDHIEETMREIVSQDLPFTATFWSQSEVTSHFAALGQQDKLDLLRYRRSPVIRMYECGGFHEYFHGAMAPSTAWTPIFRLLLLGRGFVLLLPNEKHPDTPAAYTDSPRHLSVFTQSEKWCRILGVNNVSDLSRLQENHELREFIRVNEALHDQGLVDTARSIVDHRRHIVFVAGPSSSGKTTFAGRLALQLRVLGIRAHRISLDNYYLDRNLVPKEPDGTYDLEHIRMLDLELLRNQSVALLEGKQVSLPIFNFRTQRREEKGIPMQLSPSDILIFEGIHALNPTLSEGIPEEEIYRIFVSDLTCLNLDDHNRIRTTDVRLLRRIVRDRQFRSVSPEETLAMWPSVRRGEERWIFPYQERADTIFNTALHYELPVLGHFARESLRAVPPEADGYLLALRLRKILYYIPDIDEKILEEIPPLSLLREFIGGCTIDET
ncbi:MAG: nucleoside kinase [Clostridia bacterium]|nr:nucleoside kinase [Clostridia bacterium]